ncbi:hypothetical protein P8605_05815 [Streptomyces sp. T-3]|nr:hypothetical protein [Streptomyces sp. T-3]
MAGRGPRYVLWGLWGVCLVVAVWFVGWVAWAVFVYLTEDVAEEDPFRATSTIGCDQAMEYAHGTLPAKATDQQCKFTNWMDDQAAGTFLMPRADVRDWLARTYPGEPLESGKKCYDDTVDLCMSIDYTQSDGKAPKKPSATPDAGAHMVEIEVSYEDDRTALVHLTASSM